MTRDVTGGCLSRPRQNDESVMMSIVNTGRSWSLHTTRVLVPKSSDISSILTLASVLQQSRTSNNCSATMASTPRSTLSSLLGGINLTNKHCVDLEVCLSQCESRLLPITREEARERIRYGAKEPMRGISLTLAEAPVQRRRTPLNDPVIKHRLIDEAKLENQIIALDYRLRLDHCLQNQYL
jgi:hypothetical protein